MASVSIILDTLECDKTTESGADEVYIMAFAQYSNGTKLGQRIPGEGAHWDMNDGNQPTDNPNGDSHRITNKTLFVADLQPGQSCDVVFMVMEEDGGTSQQIQAIAAQVLQQTGNPYAVA